MMILKKVVARKIQIPDHPEINIGELVVNDKFLELVVSSKTLSFARF